MFTTEMKSTMVIIWYSNIQSQFFTVRRCVLTLTRAVKNLSINPGISLLHPLSNKVFKISLFVCDDDIFRNVLRSIFGRTSDIASIALTKPQGSSQSRGTIKDCRNKSTTFGPKKRSFDPEEIEVDEELEGGTQTSGPNKGGLDQKQLEN